MLRIGVLSDTHRNLPATALAIEKMGHVEAIVHLGDFCSDADDIAAFTDVPVYAVDGNCDYEGPGLDERLLRFGGVLMLAVHGHRYEVGQGYGRLLERAHSMGADVVLYGHTHRPACLWVEDVLFFNPGHLFPGAEEGSCGVLTIDDGRVRGEFIKVPAKMKGAG